MLFFSFFPILLVSSFLLHPSSPHRYNDQTAKYSGRQPLAGGNWSLTFNCSLTVNVSVGQNCTFLANDNNVNLVDFIALNPMLDCSILTAVSVCVQSAELCSPASLCADKTSAALKLASQRKSQLYRRSLRLWQRLANATATKQTAEIPVESGWVCTLDFTNCTSVRLRKGRTEGDLNSASKGGNSRSLARGKAARRGHKTSASTTRQDWCDICDCLSDADCYESCWQCWLKRAKTTVTSRLTAYRRLNKLKSDLASNTTLQVRCDICDCYEFDCWYPCGKCWAKDNLNSSNSISNTSALIIVVCANCNCFDYDCWQYCSDCWDKGQNATNAAALKSTRNGAERFGRQLVITDTSTSGANQVCPDSFCSGQSCWSYDCWLNCPDFCAGRQADNHTGPPTTAQLQKRFDHRSALTNSTDQNVRVDCDYCDCDVYDCWWYCQSCYRRGKSANTTATIAGSEESHTAVSARENFFRDYCDYCDCDYDDYCPDYCWCRAAGKSATDPNERRTKFDYYYYNLEEEY